MDSYKIISVEAKDLFGAMNQKDAENQGYQIRGADGEISLRKFTNTFDWSLDSMKLEKVYREKTGRDDFSFKSGRHLYTKNVICVTFKYSYKEFNLAGKNTYIRSGHSYRECSFTDGIYVKDGELIGIQTGVGVENPAGDEILGKWFRFDGNCYEQVGTIPTIMDKAELRNYLYQYGFRCDGCEYVRYKRSSGSSRVGKCLFVNKELADEMADWDRCGLTIQPGQSIDLAAWEAYVSLPMSSIIGTMKIPMSSILIIDDFDSRFEDEVVAVDEIDGRLSSSQRRVEIKNSIWDGQSLMDVSLFEAAGYADKGMLLLRNQFFKSCCFNANVQRWFADNGIESVQQLNGFTLAQDISQVKLITTPSSIKYAKFGRIQDWLSFTDDTFGIVKYEKKPHPFDGRMVQAHYQLFNTLQLTYDEMNEILTPSLEYISAIRRDPAVLRYCMKYPFDDGGGVWKSMDSKNEIIFKLLGINDKFCQTKLYYDFRDDLVKSEIRNLKRGHVLVNGNYSTMIGNGVEMLQAAIGTFGGESVLGAGNIHTSRFEYGKELLCSRSPHVTV